MMTRALLVILALYVSSNNSFAESSQPTLSIIIDDIGYQYKHDQDAMALPGPLTFAVLPHTPGATRALKQIQAQGNDIMLHLPMQSSGHQHHAAPGTLTRDMDWETFVRTVQLNLAAVPGAVAVNNHQGSGLTADVERMHWLMQELAQHENLFFIDSRTTHHSVALNTAEYYGLPSARRDVFLDHKPGVIADQFKKLIQRAKKKGTALGIAHPYPETIAYLRQHIPELEKHGVRLVKLGQLIELQRKRLARK